MNIKVKYFGILAEKIGISEEEINIEFLEKKQLLSQEQKLFYWVVREKETQKFVGTIGLTPYLASKQTFHLGFRVSKEFQEKGLATELGKKVIDFVKNELKHKKIIGLIMEGNIASKALLKKLNFEFEKSYFDTDYQIQLEVYRLEF